MSTVKSAELMITDFSFISAPLSASVMRTGEAHPCLGSVRRKLDLGTCNEQSPTTSDVLFEQGQGLELEREAHEWCVY